MIKTLAKPATKREAAGGSDANSIPSAEGSDHSAAWISSLFDQTPDFIFLTDPLVRHLLEANPAARQFWGIEMGSRFAPLSLQSLFTPPSREWILKNGIEQLRRDGSWTADLEVRSAEGVTRPVSVSGVPRTDAAGRWLHLAFVARDLSESKKAQEQLRRSEQLFRIMTENATELIALIDIKGRRLYNSPSYKRVLGYSPTELQGTLSMEQIHPEDREKVIAASQEAKTKGIGKFIEYRMRHKDGSWRTLESHAGIIRNAKGEIENLLIVARDITARKEAEKERDRMEVQLRHAQKMESIGQLAAGIAHEINTPTQYIGDNLRFLHDAFEDLSGLFEQVGKINESARKGAAGAELVSELSAAAEQADLEYLTGEIPRAIEQSLEGVERVAKIVQAMKEFSHPGTEDRTATDLNKAIQSTLTVTHNEWKYVAELATQLDGSLPLVPCYPGEFNQVILNLVVNAAHAIAARAGQGNPAKGTISVSTQAMGDWVEIRIGDTGCGIPASIRERIFEPFFTTKDIGVGTGQGLAIAHSVIVDKHGGTIDFESEEGKGTTFIIRLPVNPSTGARSKLAH